MFTSLQPRSGWGGGGGGGGGDIGGNRREGGEGWGRGKDRTDCKFARLV